MDASFKRGLIEAVELYTEYMAAKERREAEHAAKVVLIIHEGVYFSMVT